MFLKRAAILAAAGFLLQTSSVAAEQDTNSEFVNQLLQTIERRDRELEKRDAALAVISQRLADLERRVAAGEASAPTLVSAPAVASGLVAPRDRQLSQAPGEIIIDEAAAERALERTLAIEGALLVPSGGIEIEPSFTYTRRETDAPGVVNGTVATNETRRNEFEGRVNLRLGLPLDSQLELGIPYQMVRQSQVTSFGFSPVQEQTARGAGLGDISVGFAKTLLRERGAAPDVIGRLTWNTDTGTETDNGVALLGNSFNELRASLTAVKRQDPLVFVGSISYQRAFEANGIRPGDQIGLGFSTFLAASPDTSLRFSLDQSFINNVTVNDREIPGSDAVVSTLSLGASTVLAPGILLDGSASIGLTNDGPDYTFRLAIPIRLNSGF